MARIRTIKPEFPQSESMGRVGREARLCFILLWTICDDSGRTRASSRMLASLLYPYDEDAGKRIDGWLGELETENCIVRYEVEGNTYLEIRNWLNHQRIDKPSASKLPPFDEASRILANPRESSCEEGKGKEGKGKEGKGRERKLATTLNLEPVNGLDPQAWERWFAFRTEIRKPIKPASVAAAQRALAKFGANQAAVVEQSIAQGWQGLFDLKPGATAVNGKPPCPPMMIDGVWNPAHKAWMEKWA